MVANFAIVLVYVIFFLMEESARRMKIENLFPEKGQKYKKKQIFHLKYRSNINAKLRHY